METVKTLPHSRSWPLGGAVLWSLVWIVVAFGYHINEPAGVLSITINNTTYAGNPPALSLFQRDPLSIYLALAVVCAALAFSVVDALGLARRAPGERSIVAAVAGALLVAFSLFGLLWGLLSIGVVGVLLVISSRPGYRTPPAQPANHQ